MDWKYSLKRVLAIGRYGQNKEEAIVGDMVAIRSLLERIKFQWRCMWTAPKLEKVWKIFITDTLILHKFQLKNQSRRAE